VALGGASAAAALAALASGCASSTPGKTAGSTAAAKTSVAAAQPSRLRIVSPRQGASTGQTVSVRVVVIGGPGAGASALRYMLDRGGARSGSERITFRGLSPGRHQLLVTLISNGGVRASRTFVVRAPARAAGAPPAQAATPMAQPTAAPQGPAQTPARAPTSSSPAPLATPRAPATTRTPSPPGPAPASTPAPARPSPAGAIPQNNGGDMDSDNNGGPSDGDGNV
jgi:hypothetical protein